MGRSILRQETQIRKSDLYDDTISASEANYETTPTNIEDDLNVLRSLGHLLLKNSAGNWWDGLNIPSALDTGTARGVNDLNTDLHANERKRILRRRAVVGADIGPIATNAQHVVLDGGAGELPGNTTAAVGAVTTLGTVVAYEASFDTATLAEVAGGDALRPKNLCLLIDTATGDPVKTSGGKEVYGLLQSESNTDGSTITVSTPNRVQLSFVTTNATHDDLVLVAAGEMDGKSIDYAATERYAFEDIPEHAWLGDDFKDAGASTATRQGGYDNQGATPVDLTTNATLDLEGAGLVWAIRDDAEATLFEIIEGSAGGTSQVNIRSDVDEFDVDAAVVDFLQGITVDSGGTAIDLGATTAGQISADGLVIYNSGAAADLKLDSARELLFDDVNQDGSTWTATELKLSDTSAEWDTYKTNFGEVSLINAINQAYTAVGTRRRVFAVVTAATIAADTDVSGPTTDNNIDTDLGDLSGGTFVDDYDFYINGQYLRPGADAAANNDVYPGTSLAAGQLKFEFKLKQGDQLCVIDYV
jgi:hypothetical protein